MYLPSSTGYASPSKEDELFVRDVDLKGRGDDPFGILTSMREALAKSFGEGMISIHQERETERDICRYVGMQ